MTTSIESLNWSAPRHGIRTARGIRSLRTANPTPSFWAEWRANKPALQAEGISCDRDDAGNWRVLHWMKPDDATALKPVAMPTLEPRDPDDDEYNNRSEANQPSQVVEEAAAAVFAARPLEVDPSVKWSDEQMAIFKWFNSGKGNLVVQARDSKGKTTTIKQAFAVAPESDMLYAVFNKKNQKEATAKITDVRVDVKTLHGLGFSFIKSIWRDAQPDDKVEYDRIVATVGDVPDDVSGAIEKLVGFAKNLYASPTLGQLEDICVARDIFTDSEDEEAGGWKADKLARAAIQVMERAKVKDSANRISFNDMVWLPVAMGWARPRYDLVVIDECFPAGTLIRMASGELKKIESVKEGESVCNAIGFGTVEKLWRKTSERLVKVSHARGEFICTPSHPILTQIGWVSACNLNATHYIKTHEQTMRLVQDLAAVGNSSRQEASFLQSVLLGEVENEPAGISSALLQQKARRKYQFQSEKELRRESKAGRTAFFEDEEEKPDDGKGSSAKNVSNTAKNRPPIYCERRERNWPNKSGINFAVSLSGISKQFSGGNARREGLPVLLQDRRSISLFEDRGGMRWEVSLKHGDSNQRQKKGSQVEGIRVVGVETIKREDFQSYGGSCSGVEVYNLKVSGHPSYVLKSGEVVHNCQDMNVPQLMMAVKACRKGGRVCVVGDDRQAIYGFRGAAQDGMALMKSKLSAATLGLTVTYRCPKLIVAEAAKLVPDYKAADSAPDGEIINTDQVQMLEQIKVGDAILSRANAPLMSTCLQILKKGIPARIEGRDIGRQLVGMVRKLKARSVPDFMARLQRWEEKQLNRLKSLKDADAKRSAIRDQRETLIAVAEGCANVSEIEQRILSLFQDTEDNQRPAVVLSSVHKAKGLEWDRVFILNWTFNKRKPKTPADAQEEKNIFYVAITRAKRQLLRVSEGGQPKPNTVTEQQDGTKAGAM